MVPLSDVPIVVRNTFFEWRNTRLADLLFARRGTAVLALVVLIGLALGLMIVRAAMRHKAGRTQVALPAVLQWTRPSWVSMVRHGALLSGPPIFNRLPMGSAPLQNRRASVSLTIATSGASSRSIAVNVRPRLIGIPSARK